VWSDEILHFILNATVSGIPDFVSPAMSLPCDESSLLFKIKTKSSGLWLRKSECQTLLYSQLKPVQL